MDFRGASVEPAVELWRVGIIEPRGWATRPSDRTPMSSSRCSNSSRRAALSESVEAARTRTSYRDESCLQSPPWCSVLRPRTSSSSLEVSLILLVRSADRLATGSALERAHPRTRAPRTPPPTPRGSPRTASAAPTPIRRVPRSWRHALNAARNGEPGPGRTRRRITEGTIRHDAGPGPPGLGAARAPGAPAGTPAPHLRSGP